MVQGIIPRFGLSLMLGLVVSSCEKEEPESPAADISGPVGTAPAHWQAGPSSPHRLASYLITDNIGAVADVSLTALPGRVESLSNIVNQWRAQWTLPPLGPAELQSELKPFQAPLGSGFTIEIEAAAERFRTPFDGGLLAVLIESPEHTFLFKMRGNAALVEQEKPGLLAWIESVSSTRSTGAPALPGDPAVPVPALTVEPGRMPAWKTPDGWSVLPPEFPDLARFSASSPTDGAPWHVSVRLLSKQEISALDHLNRWRREVGLPATTESAMAGLSETLWLGGKAMTMAELTGPRESRLVVWHERDEGFWVFLLSGPETAIAERRLQFARFLNSVQFPE